MLVAAARYWRASRGPDGRRGARSLNSCSSRGALRRQPLALVEPRLHANLPVRRARLGEAVVDVGAQGLQRKLSVQIPLRPRDFGAVQSAGHTHLDAARAEPQRRLDGLAHRAAERHALLELLATDSAISWASSSGF